MTKKQLLALAAKAHGDLLYVEEMDAWIHVDKDGNRGAWWSPLDDDGDAFRLAIKLKIDIDFSAFDVTALAWNPSINVNEPYNLHGHDVPKATRLAIVKVSAEIGDAMP